MSDLQNTITELRQTIQQDEQALEGKREALDHLEKAADALSGASNGSRSPQHVTDEATSDTSLENGASNRKWTPERRAKTLLSLARVRASKKAASAPGKRGRKKKATS